MSKPEFHFRLDYLGLSYGTERKLERGIIKAFEKSLKSSSKPTVVTVYEDRLAFKAKSPYLKMENVRKISGSQFYKTVVACSAVGLEVKIFTMRFTNSQDYQKVVEKFVKLCKKALEPLPKLAPSPEYQPNEGHSVSLSPISRSNRGGSQTMERTRRSTIYEAYNRAAVETSRRQSRSSVSRSRPQSITPNVSPSPPPIANEQTRRQTIYAEAVTPPQPLIQASTAQQQANYRASLLPSQRSSSTESSPSRKSSPKRYLLLSPTRSTKATQKETSARAEATQTRGYRASLTAPKSPSRHTVATQMQASNHPTATQTSDALYRHPKPMQPSRNAAANSKQPSSSKPSASRDSTLQMQEQPIRLRRSSGVPRRAVTPYLEHTRRTSRGHVRARSVCSEDVNEDLITSFVTSEDPRSRKCTKDLPRTASEQIALLKTAHPVQERPKRYRIEVGTKPKCKQSMKHVTKNRDGIYKYLSLYNSDTEPSTASDASEDRLSPLFPVIPAQKVDTRTSRATSPDASRPGPPPPVESPNPASNTE